MNLGLALSTIRKAKQIPQVELAKMSGITQTYLSLIENNRKEPNTALLRKISKILGVPLPVIFFLAMEPADFPESERHAFTVIYTIVQPFFKKVFISNGPN